MKSEQPCICCSAVSSAPTQLRVSDQRMTPVWLLICIAGACLIWSGHTRLCRMQLGSSSNTARGVMDAGSHAEGLPGYILCIQGEANGYYWHDNGSVLRNCRCGTALDPSYTDITFCVEGQEFQLHKAVLAAASPVFDCMFRSNMQQGVIPPLSWLLSIDEARHTSSECWLP